MWITLKDTFTVRQQPRPRLMQVMGYIALGDAYCNYMEYMDISDSVLTSYRMNGPYPKISVRWDCTQVKKNRN